MMTKATDLFRYKGVMAVKGMEQKFVFQGVHMIFSGNFNATKWKATEKRECRFVFIGRNLDKQALIDGVMACKVEGELRFKVGHMEVWQDPATLGRWQSIPHRDSGRREDERVGPGGRGRLGARAQEVIAVSQVGSQTSEQCSKRGVCEWRASSAQSE